MRRRSRIILVFALAAIGALAIAAAARSGRPEASSRSQRAAASGVKFLLDYSGTISGTWRITSPVVSQGFQCSGQDVSGSFTSTVRTGPKRYLFIVYKDLGGGKVRVYSPTVRPKGQVSSNRTAQGWTMQRSAGVCRQVPKDESGCTSNTFLGTVGLYPAHGSFAFSRDLVALEWEAERPAPAVGCDDGIITDHRIATGFGQHYARLYAKQLYRCGMRKPRSCKRTVGAKNDYPFQVTQSETTYTSNVHTEWSVTLRAVGKR